MTIYSAGRDVMRMRNADWHDKYTLPSLWDFYQPNRDAHGSYWFYWTTEDEIEWKNFYQVWMSFLERLQERRRPRHHRLGLGLHLPDLRLRLHPRVRDAAGSRLPSARSDSLGDALRRRGAARAEGQADRLRHHPAGLKADLVIVDENPLQNFKVLYGTGAVQLNDQTNKLERVGGIEYIVKDGIVYDAKKLLADVAAMVEKAKAARSTTTAGQ